MGILRLMQTLTIKAYKKPAQAGTPITQYDFQIDPPEVLNLDDYNESEGSRYNIADAVADQVIGLNTVALGKVLIIQPDQDVKIKLVNGNGTTPDIVLKGGRTSVLHAEFTSLKLSNSSGAAVTGRLFVMGD